MPAEALKPFEMARQTALTILQGQAGFGEDEVGLAVQGALAATKAVYPDAALDPDQLRRSIEEAVTIFVADSTTLGDDRDHHPWLDAERAGITWDFWDRYRNHLSLPPRAIRSLDDITNDILGRLESPNREGYWDRRGMIAGQVQSGKTSNYLGLICKAADSGYRVIVILAGLHDSLRSQTQVRVDEGFLGFDSRSVLSFNESERNQRIGVGDAIGNQKLLPVSSYTSSLPNGDFNRARAKNVSAQVGSDPVVLVVKKNKTILENLIAWTTSVSAIEDPHTGRRVVPDQPLLVIDDEADNASVNTRNQSREVDETGALKDETDPTTINRLIRKLLHSFQKSAYVGYTATPFANIFIDESAEHSEYGEDLFPRSFIIRLPSPTNYVGPAKVFGVRSAGDSQDVAPKPLPIIRRVDDYETFIPNKHRKDQEVGPLPDSLREALRAFLLSCAARRARGQIDVHNSMLIHVTRFVAVQEQVEERVGDEVSSMFLRLREGEGDSRRSLREQLRGLWERDFAPTSASLVGEDAGERLNWKQVDAELLEAAGRIRPRRINGKSADALDYADNPQGLSVVAIGGDKLSRGLTLEGLSVSYYLRASRMYDTLMQMGRWFGYRPGYLDLCRLYTTTELVDWYRDITVANEELLEEFDAMAAAGGTPRDYGLRVRKHPAGLLITARAKMRNGKEMQLDFAGSGIPTTAFSPNGDEHQANLELVERFLEKVSSHGAGPHEGLRGNYVWREVGGRGVAELLDSFSVSPRSRSASGPFVPRYIEQALRHDELTEWTVVLINNESSRENRAKVAGHSVGLTQRNPTMIDKALAVTDAYSIGQLLSPTDEWIDLSSDEMERARADTKIRWELGQIKTKRKKPPEIDGLGARRARPPQRGLLLLYPLDPKPASSSGLEIDVPIMGFYVSFPSSKTSTPVKYQVNNTFLREELQMELELG